MRMTEVAISMPGKFYLDAISKALEQTGNFRVKTLAEPLEGDKPDIALLGVSVLNGYTLGERRSLIERIREKLPSCRIVLFLDEVVSREQTEGVKNLKQARVIDGFLYASGTMEYLVATLESI